MKKLLLILLLCSPVLSQTVHYDDGTLGNVPVSTTNPLPVEFSNQNIYTLGDTALIWASDTIGSTNIDTVIKYAYYTLTNLNTMFKQYYRFTVTSDSTVQISTRIGFTSGLTFTVNTGESLTPPNTFDPTIFTNLYIKRGSAITGTVTWRIIVSGR